MPDCAAVAHSATAQYARGHNKLVGTIETKSDIGEPLKAMYVTRFRQLALPSRRQTANQIGISYSVLNDWCDHEGARLKLPNLERMARWLEIGLNEAIGLQGGTAEDHQRELGRKCGSLPKDPRVIAAAGEKSGQSRRGKHRPASVMQPMLDAAHKLARNKQVKARRALRAHLRIVPSTTPELLADLEQRVHDRTGLSRDVIASLWRGDLQSRGVQLKRGRPSLPGDVARARENEIRKIGIDWPRDRRGEPSDGFWLAAFAAIQRLEPATAPPTPAALRRWHFRRQSEG